LIEINHLTKSYSDGESEILVVNDINLKIQEGEFIAIVGQSGSGKSKLLHLIGGLENPTDGEILVFGKNITKLNDSEKSKYRREIVGYVFQDFILEGNKTVLENVMMPLVFSGGSHLTRKKIAIDCLKKVGLEHKKNQKVNQLSGGQKQKVAIARSLVNEPKILLADEPTGNLDSKNGAEIMSLLKSLNNSGYTILMVTHNTEQTLETNRVIRVTDGKIVSIESNEVGEKHEINRLF